MHQCLLCLVEKIDTFKFMALDFYGAHQFFKISLPDEKSSSTER